MGSSTGSGIGRSLIWFAYMVAIDRQAPAEAAIPEGNALSSEGSINLERRDLQLSIQAHIQFRDPRDRPLH